MKLEKITYQKAFVIGPYLQERIGVEAEITAGDDRDEVFKVIKSMVEKWHLENNPHLSEQLPEMQIRDMSDEVGEECDRFMIELAAIGNEQEAYDFLAKSTFKLYYPAKIYLKEKFKK